MKFKLLLVSSLFLISSSWAAECQLKSYSEGAGYKAVIGRVSEGLVFKGELDNEVVGSIDDQLIYQGSAFDHSLHSVTGSLDQNVIRRGESYEVKYQDAVGIIVGKTVYQTSTPFNKAGRTPVATIHGCKGQEAAAIALLLLNL